MIDGLYGHVYRGRFAPSPTGPLHFGSLLTAVGSWVRARQNAGVWLVRIEDIDPPREAPGAARRILAALAAFGMESDEPVWWQHDRGAAYADALAKLAASGAAFPCWCSRTALGSGAVHRHCVSAPDPSRAPAWRLRIGPGEVRFEDRLQGLMVDNPEETCGDVVLKRADGYWAYQLAVVVDDAAQGITEVVRGADLIDSTARQILLQRALGLPTPAYMHLPVAVDASGAKLSKSAGSLAIDPGEPLPVLRAALRLLGLAEEATRETSVSRLLLRAVAELDFAALAGRRTVAAPSAGRSVQVHPGLASPRRVRRGSGLGVDESST
jgi:glutamyl-Q tRNA(Asp) synthetase